MNLSKIKIIIEKLSNANRTISSMESCTGGGFANCITDIPGASAIFKFGAVTYSNDFKVKMGVSSKVIDKYSVYSIEVAREMSKSISCFTKSDYGIGITGKLNCEDEENPYGDNDIVYISVYDNNKNKYYDKHIKVKFKDRQKNKSLVIDELIDLLNLILP